eukprot:EG_transcript_30261
MPFRGICIVFCNMATRADAGMKLLGRKRACGQRSGFGDVVTGTDAGTAAAVGMRLLERMWALEQKINKWPGQKWLNSAKAAKSGQKQHKKAKSGQKQWRGTKKQKGHR